MSAEPATVYNKSEDVVFRKIADEFVLVPIRQKAVDLKSIYTLNETGAFIWEMVDGSKTVSEIKERIVRDFEADPASAESDTREILSQLEALTFIQRA